MAFVEMNFGSGGGGSVRHGSVERTNSSPFEIDFEIVPKRFFVIFDNNLPNDSKTSEIAYTNGFYLSFGGNSTSGSYRSGETSVTGWTSSAAYNTRCGKLNGSKITIYPATNNSGYYTGTYHWYAE